MENWYILYRLVNAGKLSIMWTILFSENKIIYKKKVFFIIITILSYIYYGDFHDVIIIQASSALKLCNLHGGLLTLSNGKKDDKSVTKRLELSKWRKKIANKKLWPVMMSQGSGRGRAR